MICSLSTSINPLCLGSVAVGGAYFGGGNGDIFLDNVVCRGTESSLLECSTNLVGQQNCNHFEDAGVRCEGIHNASKPRLHSLSMYTLHILGCILCLHYVF